MKKIYLTFALLFFLPLSSSAQQSSLTPKQVKGKWGYADSRGKLVIAARFDVAKPFRGKFGPVGMRDENVPAERDELAYRWGYVDETGRVIVEPRYNHLREFSEGLAAVAVLANEKVSSIRRRSNDDLRWGFVDLQGQLVIPTQYRDAGDFSEGLAKIGVGEMHDSLCPRDGKFGYIDKTGKIVIEPQFGTAADFRGGRARVGKGEIKYVGRCLCCAPQFQGEWGYVDKTGTFIPDKK